MPNSSPSPFARFVGGHPLAVLGKLLLASLIVGAILWTLDLTPNDLVRRIGDLLRTMWDMAGDLGRNALTWILLGAVVVLPIWFVTRLLALGRRG